MRFGVPKASTLAERASLLFPSLTRIAQGMKARGLIKQEVNPDDRRRRMIAITDQERKVIDDNLPQAVRTARCYRERLGDANFETLLDLLEQLYARVQP